MEQYSTPTTTADSNADGRMVVGVGSGKKCLKCAIKKKKVCVCDGKGGCGIKHDGKGGMPSPMPSYGTTAKQAAIKSAERPVSMTSKSHKASSAISSLRSKGIKSSSKFSKLAQSRMKLGKSSSRMNSPKALKGMIKGLF